MLLNTAKFQGYSFNRFRVIKEKPTEGLKLPPPTQIRVNLNNKKSTMKFNGEITLNLGWHLNKIWSFIIMIVKLTDISVDKSLIFNFKARLCFNIF